MTILEQIQSLAQTWDKAGRPHPPAWLVGVVVGGWALKWFWGRRPGHLLAGMREDIASDPAQAYRSFKVSGKKGHELGLTPTEFLDVYQASGHDKLVREELFSGYPPAYALDVACLVSERGDTPASIPMINDETLRYCAGDGAAAARLIALYATARRVKELARVRCAGQGPEVATGMAKALLAYGPEGAEHAVYLLWEKTQKTPEDEALIAQGLLAMPPEQALRVLMTKLREDWTPLDYEICVRLYLALGQTGEARKLCDWLATKGPSPEAAERCRRLLG